MNKIFKVKEKNITYQKRTGAYLLVINQNEVGVIKTTKGLFLIGGGHEKNESDMDCMMREALEETGYEIQIKQYLGCGETYESIEGKGNIHFIQHYYIGTLMNKKYEPKESNHELIFVDWKKCNLKIDSQKWALDMATSLYEQ